MDEMLFEDARVGMEKKGLNVMSDMGKIMADQDKYAYYLDSLAEGLDLTQAEHFKILAENSRREFLFEANTSASLNAFAPLQPTLLRCIIPRLVTQNAINYNPMNTPVSQFGWLKPFITRPDGTKVSACDTLSTKNFYGEKVSKDIAVPAVDNQIAPAGKILDRIYKITSVSGTLADGKTVDDIEYLLTTDIIGDTYSDLNNLSNGSEGSLFDSTTGRLDNNIASDLLVKFFSGLIDENVLNFKKVSAKVIIDANYGNSVKLAMSNFTENLRTDFPFN